MDDLTLFLKNSNAIEDVFDEDSLKQARYAWDYCISEPKLTPGVILKTHKILMLNQPLRPDERGYFRKRPVWVGGREGLHYSKISEAIKSWCELVNDKKFHKEENSWKYHHIDYEEIHPFIDGNGRTGRIFMNWQRIRSGLPIVVIRASRRYKYYEWFKD